MGRRNNRRNPDRPIRRRGPSRSQKTRVLVVCEGAKTEPQYLRGLSRTYRSSPVDIVTRVDRPQPIKVVEEAIRVRDEDGDFDAVWCVFDVDEHQLDAALEKAKQEDIMLAISNPCFELWLLLHFCDQHAFTDSKAAQRALKKYIGDYDKSGSFKRYSRGYHDAVGRAQRLHKGLRCGPNPSTGVWRLTELIRLGSSLTGREP